MIVWATFVIGQASFCKLFWASVLVGEFVDFQVVELDTQLAPLQDHCQQLEAERDVLQKEIEMLKDEVDRWKARTNRLVEQCNKFDPEELKKAMYACRLMLTNNSCINCNHSTLC